MRSCATTLRELPEAHGSGKLTMLRPAHIPNAICIMRMLLVIPTVAALLQRRFDLALLLVFVAGLSDAADGYLAKRFDWSSRLGGLLDPLADKLLLVTLFLMAAWLGLIPRWLTVMVVTRDVMIGVGAAFDFHSGRVPQAPRWMQRSGLEWLYRLGRDPRRLPGSK